jgi:hypothetical protein
MIYGLMGNQRSGKDECAKVFLKHGYQTAAFADPIKDIAKSMFLFSEDQLYSEEKDDLDDRWKIKPRETFQFIGTDAMRDLLSTRFPEIGKDIWIRNLQYRLQQMTSDVVVTDIRFQNEFDMLKHVFGATIIKITRPSLKQTLTHSSETGISSITGYDHEIVNNGTLSELYEKVECIID